MISCNYKEFKQKSKMTVQTAVKRSTCSGNPKSFTCKNTHWIQTAFSLHCKTVRKRHTAQHNSS